MPAACRLLGVEGPPQAREILKNSQKLVDSLGSDMLNLVMMRSVPLYDEPCLQTSRPLPRTIQDTLIGCVALGKQVVPGEDGPQFKEVTFE